MTTDRNSEGATVETVGFVRKDRDGDFYLDWTIEGGIIALGVGCELIASGTKLTDDTGIGEVYLSPPASIPAAEVQALVERCRNIDRDGWRADEAFDWIADELAKLIPRNPE